MLSIKHADVDGYISGFPEDTQRLLSQVRTVVRKAAPKAKEVISYNMPAYKMNGVLVYFAGYARHIGFYPTASGIAAFREALAPYKSARGSVQFPVDKPMPLALIAKIVKYRLTEDERKATLKQKPKPVKAAAKTQRTSTRRS